MIYIEDKLAEIKIVAINILFMIMYMHKRYININHDVLKLEKYIL